MQLVIKHRLLLSRQSDGLYGGAGYSVCFTHQAVVAAAMPLVTRMTPRMMRMTFLVKRPDQFTGALEDGVSMAVVLSAESWSLFSKR